MGSFGVVQPQCAGQSVEHLLGDTGEVAAFQADVVIGADTSEQRDLFPAQSGNSPLVAIGRKAGLFRGDVRATGGEELTHVVPDAHPVNGTGERAVVERV